MRKVMSMFAAGGALALLAGCSTAATPQSAAPSAAPTIGAFVTATASGQPDSSPSADSLPVATPTAIATTSRPAAAPTSPKPVKSTASSSSGQSGSGAVSTSYGYFPSANAQAQINAAAAAAKSDGKEVLLDFGATWCGNCVAMDSALHTSQVQSVLNASYHLVQIDIGDNIAANMRILEQYDSTGSYGLPVLIVLSPSGSILVDTNKSGNPGFDESGFLAFLKRWAA